MFSGFWWRSHSPRYLHLHRVDVPTASLAPARSIPSSICPMWDVRYQYLRVLPRCFVRLALPLTSAASLPPHPSALCRALDTHRAPCHAPCFAPCHICLPFVTIPPIPFPSPWLLPCVSLTVLITIYDRCSVSIYTDPTYIAQLPSYLF